MELDPKQLLVAIKSFARVNPIPLDADEVHSSLAAAEAYAASPVAYPGQTIKALVDGEYVSFVLNGTEPPFTLSKVGSVDADDLKTYVQVVEALPAEGMEQGVIYINTVDKKGYIYNGTEFVVIFQDVEQSVADLEEKIETKAPLDSPVFTGTVTLPADPTQDLEAATKQYVDRLIEGIVSCAPGVVDSENPLPQEGFKAGQTWRVAEAGEYAGRMCEPGDLIICITDYAPETASDDNFMVVQSNIDGAVTGPDASTDANVVIFDGVTGKKIADSSVTIASVQDAIAKAHEHANKEILDTFDKTQEEILEAAATDATSKVDAAKKELQTAIADAVADIDLSGYVTTEALAARVGDIPETTDIKTYVDNAIGSGGTDSAEAIAKAKQEAIEASQTYTDNALTIIEY